ncbi:MAG TPA: DUF4276 family protein [Sphaerochaeta sp.]|nr:DUF4276 family protein [Sphaerochaeta sp.]
MNEVIVIVEGQSEQSFLRSVLAPYLGEQSCYIRAQLIGPSGHKGGGVSFERFSKDVGNALKQRGETYISSMFDFFRLDSTWPGMDDLCRALQVGRELDKNEISTILQEKTLGRLETLFPKYAVTARVFPYFSMHEFEALLFSDVQKLSEGLSIHEQDLQRILDHYNGDPELINTDPSKAPSKVLKRLYPHYKKVLQGTYIAQSIGVEKIKDECTCFNSWVTRMLEFS